MNCKNVEELLPLYVGRDLEEKRARLVTAHVQACTQCARSAEEYGEANQLLQLFEPPQFGDETYAAVRGGVLGEIERKSSAPGLLEFLRRPLPLHVTWAVTAAVMVVVGVSAYYFLADRMSREGYRRQLTANSGNRNRNAPGKPTTLGTAGGRGPQTGSPAGVFDPPATATNSPRPRLNQTSHNETGGAPPTTGWHNLRLNQIAWHSKRTDRTLAPVRSVRDFPEPKGPTLNASVTSEKPLRLEIQTNDPNVRIIWFSHPPSHEGSPNESSKGI